MEQLAVWFLDNSAMHCYLSVCLSIHYGYFVVLLLYTNLPIQIMLPVDTYHY